MKKRTRHTLVAGGVLFAVVCAVVGTSRMRYRLPTLPTPPGAVVPAGLRYVGGSEFDGELSDEEERLWKFGGERAIDGRNGFAIADGVLRLTLRKDGDGGFPMKPLSYQSDFHSSSTETRSWGVFLEAPWVLDFRRPGRIEIRAKVPLGNHHDARVRISEEGWNLSGRFFSMIESEPTLGCSWPDFFEKENDGEFHTYVFRWGHDDAAFFIDDETQGSFKRSARSPSPYSDFFWSQGLRSRVPSSWTTNPDVRNFVNRRVWVLDKKTAPLIFEIPVGLGMGHDRNPAGDELVVDFIRIYQE